MVFCLLLFVSSHFIFEGFGNMRLLINHSSFQVDSQIKYYGRQTVNLTGLEHNL